MQYPAPLVVILPFCAVARTGPRQPAHTPRYYPRTTPAAFPEPYPTPRAVCLRMQFAPA